MGQYWIPVNLTKREYVNPHKLACGLKLWEQLANSPGTGGALLVLTAAMPVRRGGGDFEENPTVGRWAGDQIALVGDYAEDGDLPNSPIKASEIYDLCRDESDVREALEHYKGVVANAKFSEDVARAKESIARQQKILDEGLLFRDISDDVCAVIEKELNGKFKGDGWRDFDDGTFHLRLNEENARELDATLDKLKETPFIRNTREWLRRWLDARKPAKKPRGGKRAA